MSYTNADKIAAAKAEYNLDLGDKVIYSSRSDGIPGLITKFRYSIVFNEVMCFVRWANNPVLVGIHSLHRLKKTGGTDKKNPNSTFKRKRRQNNE